ncbi:MAG: hypothetical protein JWN08_1062 [Frankiales bacterium]|nr:hypothetical protein [Frankiales bacterium]
MAIRLVAGVAFVLAATVLPKGVPAALVVVLAGVAAVLTCFGTNAGGPGERAGARPQDRYFDSILPPQGDWPPYDPGAVDTSAPRATVRHPDAS